MKTMKPLSKEEKISNLRSNIEFLQELIEAGGSEEQVTDWKQVKALAEVDLAQLLATK